MTRRLFILFGLALCLGVGRAEAQALSNIIFDTNHYTGPGDSASFTAWWGLRAYNASVAATGTQKSVDLRRVSDNATCTALIGKTGNIDLTVGTPCNGSTQTVTAWVGASSARVSKIYDQTSGNQCGSASCDLVQATASSQPLFIFNCIGALPCLKAIGDGSSPKNVASANNFTPAGTRISLSTVAQRVSGTQGALFISDNSLVNGHTFIASTVGSANSWTLQPDLGANFANTAATDAAWHAANAAAVTNPATTSFNVDGTETTNSLSMTVGTTAGKPAALSVALGGTVTIEWAEGGFQDAVTWSSGTRTALCHNQRLYWGTGGSC